MLRLEMPQRAPEHGDETGESVTPELRAAAETPR